MANASNFSLNEDIKLPMGGGYQPTSSVGVFGGPRQTTPSNAQGLASYVDGGFLPLPPHLRSKAGLPPLQQAPLTPDMMKNYNQPISPELRSSVGLPQPMPTGYSNAETTRGPQPNIGYTGASFAPRPRSMLGAPMQLRAPPSRFLRR